MRWTYIIFIECKNPIIKKALTIKMINSFLSNTIIYAVNLFRQPNTLTNNRACSLDRDLSMIEKEKLKQLPH